MSVAAEGGGMGGLYDGSGDNKKLDIPESLLPIDKLKLKSGMGGSDDDGGDNKKLDIPESLLPIDQLKLISGMGGSDDDGGDNKKLDIPELLLPIDQLKLKSVEPEKLPLQSEVSSAMVVEQAKLKLMEQNDGSPGKKPALVTLTNWEKLSSEVATGSSLEKQEVFHERGWGTTAPPSSPVRGDGSSSSVPTISGDDAKEY